MKRIVIPLFFLVLIASAEVSLQKFVSQSGRELFKLSQDDVIQKLKIERMTWNTKDHSQMRYDQRIAGDSLELCGVPVREAIFTFTKQKLNSIQVSVFTRGDCGDWPSQKFDLTAQTLAKGLCKFTKVQVPMKSQNKIGDSTVAQFLWRTSVYDVSLRWSKEDTKGEYITVLFEGSGKTQSVSQDMRTFVRPGELASRIKKNRQGDVWLDIPMVNQGDKGYCHVAVLERFMKYYNSSMDQHVFAQIFDSDPTRGTNVLHAAEILQENQMKLGLKTTPLYKNDYLNNNIELTQFIKDYNRVAKQNKQKSVPIPKDFKDEDVLKAVFSYMDKATFVATRHKGKPGPRRMMMQVQNSINRGIPIFWGVLIFPGDLKEQPVLSFHTRIISGYNSQTNEIIYTDSWGYGHEKKSMKLPEAWAISTFNIAISPR